MVGDTDSSDKLLQDDEVSALVSIYGNKFRAMIAACRAIAAKLARKAVDTTVGDLRSQLSQQYDHYMDLAERFESEYGLRVKPFAGGISVSGKEAVEDDTDRVKPSFTMGGYDHSGAGDQNPLTSTQ